MYQTLLVEPGPGSLRIQLNRPDARNSLSSQMLLELHRALDEAERDPECRMVILHGSADHFCSGMDLAETATDAAADSSGQMFFSLLRRFTETPRLVICAVTGRVSGGGVGLVAAADLVVAAPTAVFSLPEALWGLLPCCVLPFLIRRVGFQKAYSLTLTTQAVTAEQAHRFHLVDEVADAPEAVIGRLSFRARKLTDPTLRAAKRYFGELCPITPATEALAVGELDRLLGTADVKAAIEGFAIRQEFPWTQRA